MKLSIVIPCYNEQLYISEVLKRVQEAQLPLGVEREIIIVNDGSIDNTKEILEKYSLEAKILHKIKNEGKGAAVKLGLQQVTGDYIIIQDADLEYDPKDYIKMLQPIIDGHAEIIFGSRNLKLDNHPFSKIFYYGGALLSQFFNVLFGTAFTDIFSCYKMFPAHVINHLIALPSDDFTFDGVELTYILSCLGKVKEVSISYVGRSRKEGKKIGIADGGWFLLAMFRIKLRLYKFVRMRR